MKFWVFSFIVIFGLGQFCFWIKNIFLPLPIYIFIGAFLAISSNYEKGIMTFLGNQGNALKRDNSDSGK